MEDIELVIKIPEEVKNRLCFGVTYQKDILTVCEALNNGISLPKGHGRLIDADVLPEISLFGTTEYINVNKAPTIIKADKAESE